MGRFSKKLLWIILSITLLLQYMPCVPVMAEKAEEKTIEISGETITRTENVEIKSNIESDTYQWEIQIGELWVPILDANEADIVLTPAMVSQAADSEGVVSVRLKYDEEGETNCTESIELNYEEKGRSDRKAVKKKAAKAPSGDNIDDDGEQGELTNEDAETYNIVVNFQFNDGTIARDPIVATVVNGSAYHNTITIDQIAGYDSFLNDGTEPVESFDIDIDAVNKNYSYRVIYRPALVEYRVEHYWEDVYGGSYHIHESEVMEGYSGDVVPDDIDKIYNGFYSLLYDTPVIAADGSTVVRIHYDRFYYLIDYDTKGGTGADPIYARYGTPLTAPTPVKPGYIFSGWSPAVPETIPVGGGTYEAQWTPTNTTYTVLYWYEDTTGVDKYSVVGSETVQGISGQSVNSDAFQNAAFEGRDDAHFTYNAAKAETKTIAGNGTTVLNVFFTRNIITFRFHYEDDEYDIYEMSGRWGSTFSSNGQSWPQKYDWRFTNTSGSWNWMTFMDAYLPTQNMPNQTVVDFYHATKTGNKIYFLKQNIDGTYVTSTDTAVLEQEADNIVTATANGTFSFSEKYEGFSLKDYQGSGTNYRYTYTKNGQTHTYLGPRLVSTTGNTGAQYGIIDGELVELDYVTETRKVWRTRYTYTPTTSTSSYYTYYGIVNGEYGVVTRDVSWRFDDGEKYEGTYVYQPTTSTSGTLYGVVNGNIVPIEYGYYYTNENNEQVAYDGYYKYIPTTSSSGTQYGIVNGQVQRIYYRRSQWRTTNSNNGSIYTGDRYTRDYASNVSTGACYGFIDGEMVRLYAGFIYGNNRYQGDRYTRTYTSYANSNETYYALDNSVMRPLTYGETWIMNDRPYTGTRYTRSTNYSDYYTGTRYTRSGSAAPYTYKKAETEEGTQYGLDANGGYQELVSEEVSESGWYPVNDPVNEYTGQRYMETTATSGTLYGFVDGELVTLSRSSYSGFGDTWTRAYVGDRITTNVDYIIRYERNKYKIEYYNYNYYMDSEQHEAYYEAPLSEELNFKPEYPFSLPYDAYEFVGWYDNQELLGEPFDFNTTMPAHDIVLFAKYQPKQFTAKIYDNLIDMTNDTGLLEEHTVDYGTLIPTPTAPIKDNMTFVGWFFLNRYGEETPFQFSTRTVTQDYRIYAKWSSEVLVNYDIHYELEDGTPVADPIYSSALEGSTKTFKATDEVYLPYEEGYFPMTASHSILFERGGDNSYTFIYKYFDAVPYTVMYLDERTGEALAPSKIVNDNKKISVVEKFLPIEGYISDKFQKSLTVSASDPAQNIIIFYYEQDDDHANYLTTHYIETKDGGWKVYNALETRENIGASVTASPISIPGYTFDPTVEGTVTSGTVVLDGLELKLYYVSNAYPYKVRYLEDKTYRVLHEEKTGSGKMGSVVSENAVDIPGYNLVTPATQSITITTETDENNIINNVITFFYRVDQAEYNYYFVTENTPAKMGNEFVATLLGEAEGYLAEAPEGYEFGGWYLDEDCTEPAPAAWLSEEGRKVTPQKEDVEGVEKYVSHNFYARFTVNASTLTVKKIVTGNMGNRMRDFNFTVRITNGATPFEGTVSYTGDKTGTLTFVDGEAAFTLAHDEEITIDGMPVGATYTIIEDNYAADGYTTTYYDQTGTISRTAEDNSVLVRNDNEVAVATGYRNGTAALYLLLMLATLLTAFRFNRETDQ